MPDRPDSNYSNNPWMRDIPIAAKRPVYNSYEDQLQYETLVEALAMPSDQIRAIRPPVGNPPFPPRTGYEQRQPTIQDVLTIGPDTLIRDTATRQETGMQGSPRNAMGQW